jgi:hypothetical protein
MLFGVACLRRIWDLLTDPRSREVVEATERVADDVKSDEVQQACDDAWEAFWQARRNDELQDGAGGNTHEALEDVVRSGALAAISVANKAAEAVGWVAATAIPSDGPEDRPEAWTAAWKSAERAERAVQAALLHDIVGNPFRPPVVNPAWRTPRVVSLARTIYDQRAFERMPKLADALEAAGCADPAFLDHCRRPGVHARGCWALDAILLEG